MGASPSPAGLRGAMSWRGAAGPLAAWPASASLFCLLSLFSRLFWARERLAASVVAERAPAQGISARGTRPKVAARPSRAALPNRRADKGLFAFSRRNRKLPIRASPRGRSISRPIWRIRSRPARPSAPCGTGESMTLTRMLAYLSPSPSRQRATPCTSTALPVMPMVRSASPGASRLRSAGSAEGLAVVQHAPVSRRSSRPVPSGSWNSRQLRSSPSSPDSLSPSAALTSCPRSVRLAAGRRGRSRLGAALRGARGRELCSPERSGPGAGSGGTAPAAAETGPRGVAPLPPGRCVAAAGSWR